MRFSLNERIHKMDNFDLLTTFKSRNEIYYPYLSNLTANGYIIDKMKYGSYKINAEVEINEVDDAGVRLRYTLVTDHDEDVVFMTDIDISLISWQGVGWEYKNLFPVDFEEIREDEKYLYKPIYFVYGNNLVLIGGHNNRYICCRLCTIHEELLKTLIVIYDDLTRLTRADVATIMQINESFM